MRILHATDLHLRASRAEESIKAIDKIADIAVQQECDLIALSGDTWDGPIQNTTGSYFPLFVARVRFLASMAPVVMIYGTPSHDTEGSLEVFEQVESRYGITILRPGASYFLSNGKVRSEWETPGEDKLLIYGVPEPSKKWIARLSENKEAAETGGRQALRNLFLGLAAKRKEHAELPCLLLYHGEIAGASTATGYQSEQNTNLVVTKEDIEMVGADYVACGHIHEPQNIGDNIYYAGSAYPQNWGETHQAGVNIVELNSDSLELFDEPGDLLSVQRVDLPFPQRMKIELDFSNVEDRLDDYDYSGRMVWLEITCTQDVANSGFDPKQLEKHIIHDGALEGSRVTLNVLPTETVRAEEIAEAQRLRDKVKVWAESSGDDPAYSVLEKADSLEEEVTRSGQAGDGAHIRIDRLDLRGSIGIWKGTGLDTISIDFADYDPGLIALIGSNGKGKTTLIENMHPWNQMLTREGKLQDHFRLRDSYRDLYFTDERTGTYYRALMQIDGQNKSGSVDYYLYRWNGAEWEPMAGINGRRDPYIEAVENLYGSLQLYLRSAFISQRPTNGNPDLSDATKGERKSLFRELAGLDYLQAYSDMAKEQYKILENEIATDTGRLETLESLVDDIPALSQRVEAGENAVGDLDQSIDDTINAVEQATYNHESAEKRLEAHREIQRQISYIDEQTTEISDVFDGLMEEKRRLKGAVERKEASKNTIAEYESLTARRAELQKQYQEHLEKKEKLNKAWYAERDETERERQKYRDAITEHNGALSGLQSEKAAKAAKAESLREKLSEPVSDICPTCGQSWSEEKKQVLISERDYMKGQLKEIEEEIEYIEEEIASYRDAIKTDGERIEAITNPPEPEIPAWDKSEVDRIDESLGWIDIEQEREVLRLAEQAETKIEHIESRILELGEKKADFEKQRKKLSVKLDPESESEEQEYRFVLEKLETQLTMLRDQKTSWTAKLEELKSQLASLEEKKSEAAEIRVRLEKAHSEVTEWQYLQKACGPDGIQALELDALAPSIAMVANRLLQAAYDSRFRIEFRTTRIGGSGSKVKQMETFEVYIHDTEAGTEQELKTLSGGEGVWIKKAIYDAFGIIRAQNTGTSFLTAFQDEADGALDPDARERYFRMLEAAHTESGRRHTIVITHSREIQEMIEQRIVMDELVEAKEAVAV